MEKKVHPEAEEKFEAFKQDVLGKYARSIHSVHMTGSAVTGDYEAKRSDVNSVFVLEKMDLEFLKVLAPMGKKYRKKQVAAPLIMTSEYIDRSLDVFPIEFLNIHLFHHTVHGEDLFSDMVFGINDLRTQLERELKSRLIGIRQGYLSSEGDRDKLLDGFIRSFSGYIPLFRSILFLEGHLPPGPAESVIRNLEKSVGIDMSVFQRVLTEKQTRKKMSLEALNEIFEAYYDVIDRLSRRMDSWTEDRESRLKGDE